MAIFFCVSGFVVAEANTIFYAGRPLAFMVNRLVRLVPGYFAALLLAMAVHEILWQRGALDLWDYPDCGPPLTGARVLVGILGLTPGLGQVLPVASFEFLPFVWSLRLEMAFYAAVALTLMLAAWTGRQWIVPGAMISGLAASLCFAWRMQPGIASTIPMFLSGVALWLAVSGRQMGRMAYLLAVVPVAGLGFATLRQHGHPVLGEQLLLLGILFCIFAILTAWKVPLSWQAVDRGLGDVSYPLYLNHYVVGILLTDLTAQRGMPIYCVAVALSVGLAAAMGRAVDGRLVRLRNRFRGRSI